MPSKEKTAKPLHMVNFIHPTALINPGTKIGTGNYFGPFCMVGFPPESRGYVFEECQAVTIGDNNHFAGHCTIDSGAVIGDNLFMMKHAHVGHDCTVQDDVTLCTGSVLGGHVTVEKGANIVFINDVSCLSAQV